MLTVSISIHTRDNRLLIRGIRYSAMSTESIYDVFITEGTVNGFRFCEKLPSSYSHHYTKITVVRASVRACVRAGGHRKRADPCAKSAVSLQNWSLSLHLVAHWHGRNCSSSSLNQTCQKRAGQNRDRQTNSPVAARRRRNSNAWNSRLSTCAS